MEIRFWAGGSDQDEDQRQDIRSLHEWLRDDRELRLAGVRIGAVAGAGQGRMGIGPEEIGALCGALSLGLQLVDSIRAWRQGRQPTTTINVSVLGGEPGQAEQIAAALRSAGLVPQDRDESHEPTVSPGTPPADHNDDPGGSGDGDSGGNGGRR
ncbi:effector-associated constant component EACC1 [Streptomyces bluensis]|uniref:effector-associated constant component EACC1 n=1 Tax=Streptomyces bluensis TaxID=33897 RepID=UPI00332498ED